MEPPREWVDLSSCSAEALVPFIEWADARQHGLLCFSLEASGSLLPLRAQLAPGAAELQQVGQSWVTTQPVPKLEPGVADRVFLSRRRCPAAPHPTPPARSTSLPRRSPRRA